jgi:hypothetical protein
MAQTDKIATLKQSKSPKLVLLGGSNLAFGIDSGLISRAFSIPVVNMGLHAEFGIKHMLDSVGPFLNSNDILVIIPEYELFTDSLLKGGTSLVELGLATEDLSLVLKNWRHLLKANKVIFFWKPMQSSGASPYRRSSFNEYGDITSHLALANKAIVPYKLDSIIADDSFGCINAFHKSRPGLKIFVIHPGIMHSASVLNQKMITNIADKQKLLLKDVLISSSENFIFEDKYFYDTVYHLNAEGRRLRTDKVITLLKEKLH